MRTIEEIEARAAEIDAELEKPEADLEALETEKRALATEAEELRRAALAAEEQRKQIADGTEKVTVIETRESEEKPMTELEVRNSAEYVDAFAKYLRSGDDRECRALLKTENASGKVPVPVMVDEIIRHAWDNEELLSKCRKTNFRGNLKVAFEKAGDNAYVHTEGTSAPTEEALELGIVTMTPANIKKWIHITDEDVTMGGEAFVRYIYEELAYQIMKKLAALVVTDITALDTSNGTTAPGAARITEAPGLTTIANAFANLSDEATNPVIIMNKLTWANFQAAYAAGSFAVDPFMGLPVIFNNTLPAYDTATGGTDDYCIVGDLKGAQLNYPEGEGVVIKWDDLSEAEADLVKVVGRQYVAHAVTAPFRFTRIKKPVAAS
jgi:HK97 family phage major capsid protein